MTDKLIMKGKEILDELVYDYLLYDGKADTEPFSEWAGVILYRIMDMDKQYKTTAQLDDAEPVRPVDLYERRIAVLERENNSLRLTIEQNRAEISKYRKEVKKAKYILDKLFRDSDLDCWQKHLAEETKEQCN